MVRVWSQLGPPLMWVPGVRLPGLHRRTFTRWPQILIVLDATLKALLPRQCVLGKFCGAGRDFIPRSGPC